MLARVFVSAWLLPTSIACGGDHGPSGAPIDGSAADASATEGDGGSRADGGSPPDGDRPDSEPTRDAGGAGGDLPADCPTALVLADDFESGDLEAPSGTGRWTDSSGDSGSGPRVEAEIARSGTQALRFRFLGDADPKADAWSEQRFDLGADLTDVCVEWFQYVPDGSEGFGARYAHRDAEGPDNNKLLRLWDDDYRDYRLKLGFSTVHADGDDSRVISEYGVDGAGVGPEDTAPWLGIVEASRGRWIRFVARARTDRGSGDGVLDLWVDGDKVMENRLAMVPEGGEGNYFRNGYLLGWANSGFAETTFVWIDDVRIVGTP
jgi:hypothetical protein